MATALTPSAVAMPTPQPQQNTVVIPQWKEAVAGASAGALSRTLMAPVERVKLIKQLQNTVEWKGHGKDHSLRMAWNVYREQGLLSFWRGNLPNVMRVSGTAAINFTCMDYYKRSVGAIPFFRNSETDIGKRRRKLVTSFVAGGMAGATSTTVLYPVEFVRTRLAMDMGRTIEQRQYTGMVDVLRSIVRTDGVSGLYQGYSVALAGGIVYRILLLGGYDALKYEVRYRKQQQSNLPAAGVELSWGERILSAQVIALTAGTVSYPFDSVRRRLMMQAGKPVEERMYQNSLHCISSMYRTEGLRGFYLGLGPNVVRSIGGALLLVGYDTFKALLA